jgi:hypothetical protein
VILVLYVLVPLAVMLVVAAMTHYVVVDSKRGAPAPIGGLFLGIEALLTIIVVALVQWTVNLPDEERCRADYGVTGSLSLVLILGTAAVAGIPLAAFVGDTRRFGATFWRVLAIALVVILPYVTLAAIIYSFLTCLS